MPNLSTHGVPATGDARPNYAHVHTTPRWPDEDAPQGSIALDVITSRGSTAQAFLTPAEATALAHDLLSAVRQLAPALTFPLLGPGAMS